MQNALIAWNNRIDAATLSGGAWESSLPRANMQNRTLGRVAQTAGLSPAATQFDFDFGASRFVRLLALANHNLSLDALVRLRLGEAADFSTVAYDSGWIDAWPIVYPLGTFQWGDPRVWTGKYTAEEIAGYTLTRHFVVPAQTVARYGRIEIDDQANAAGCIRIGRLFAGDGWQPAYNMSYGVTHAWETDTAVQRARSGAEYFDRRAPRRVARVRFDWLSEREAWAGAFEIQRQMGIDMEVFYLYDPADTVHSIRRSFLGRLRELSAIEHPHYGAHRAAFEIQELL